MESREIVLKNPLFTDLKKVGHKPEEDIYVWSMGLGLHNNHLQNRLRKEVISSQMRENIYKDLWKNFYAMGLEKVNSALGVTANPDLDAINKTLDAIMTDKNHPAISGVGDYVEEAILNWVRAFAAYDWSVWTYMEKWLGAKQALNIYMWMWEEFSLGELDHWKSVVGITDESSVTMKQLGELSRVYWESIGCPYKVTQDTEDTHEAELEDCPYWQNMKDLFGEAKARSMTLKTEAHVSVNYYDAILKAMGIFDRFSFTMDRFLCCGDDCCRVRFQRRK